MAPSRTTNKSTTTPSETVTRNGHRKRLVEEIGEESKDDEMQDVEEPNSQENSLQSEAAGPPDNGLAELIGRMVDTQRKRLQVSKNEIHKSYISSKTETQETIISLFDDHEANASEAHGVQLTMLHQFLARKASLEAKMSAKLTQLEPSYVAHCHALQYIAEHRAKALE